MGLEVLFVCHDPSVGSAGEIEKLEELAGIVGSIDGSVRVVTPVSIFVPMMPKRGPDGVLYAGHTDPKFMKALLDGKINPDLIAAIYDSDRTRYAQTIGASGKFEAVIPCLVYGGVHTSALALNEINLGDGPKRIFFNVLRGTLSNGMYR
jgi:hypothetical protein